MRIYYDPSVSWNQLRSVETGIMQDAAVYAAQKVRQRLLNAERFDPANVRRFTLLPMDVRFCYHTLGAGPGTAPAQSIRLTFGLESHLSSSESMQSRIQKESRSSTHARSATTMLFLKHAYYVPLMLHHEAPPPPVVEGQADFLNHVEQPGPTTTANLSDAARAYLASIGITDPDRDMDTAALLWRHVLAIGYAPAYLAEHEDGIRADWPRIPLPATQQQIRASAGLGQQLAALLDTEVTVPHVTSGVVRPELRVIADLTKLNGTPPDPNAGDFDLRARWGYASTNGIIMGGTGRLIAGTIRMPNARPSRLVPPLSDSPSTRPSTDSARAPATSFSTIASAGGTSLTASGSSPSAAIRSSRSGSATANMPCSIVPSP